MPPSKKKKGIIQHLLKKIIDKLLKNYGKIYWTEIENRP